MAAMTLSVVAPDRTVFEGEVRSAIVPAEHGYLGVMPGHEPLIAALKTGVVEYIDPNDQRRFLTMDGGFMEVSEGSIIILADHAERAEEIDAAVAEDDLRRAREALSGQSTDMTRDEARHTLNRAMARIEASKRDSGR